jgi:hypothetical protein
MKRVYLSYVQIPLLVLGTGILVVKILNWFLDFSDPVMAALNTAMFLVIGLYYLGTSLLKQSKLLKAAYLLCGLVLLTASLLPKVPYLEFAILFAVIIPMILSRIVKEPDTIPTASSD